MSVYPLVGSSTRRDMEVKKLLILQFTIIGSCLLLSEGRLLEKSPDKVKTTPEPDLVQSTIFKRVARKVLYKLKDFSKEDESSNEVSKGNGKKMRHETKTNGSTRIQARRSRIARQSVDHHYIAYDKRISVPDNSKPKKVFIKKPIPKFYELNYDNDFQNNIDKFPAKLLDSAAEHEDEDFNVDDYDFDVNHDEYVGRGKPLEPRLKKVEDKVLAEFQKQEEKAKKPSTIPSVTVIPSTKIVITPQVKQKREYPAVVPYKPSLKKEDDYSNEFPSSSSTDKTPNNRAYDDDDDDDDDDDADDADEILDKESSHKIRATRTVSNRSFYNAPVEKKRLVTATATEDVPIFTHLTNALSDPNDYSLEDYQTWNANSPNSDSMAYF